MCLLPKVYSSSSICTCICTSTLVEWVSTFSACDLAGGGQLSTVCTRCFGKGPRVDDWFRQDGTSARPQDLGPPDPLGRGQPGGRLYVGAGQPHRYLWLHAAASVLSSWRASRLLNDKTGRSADCGLRPLKQDRTLMAKWIPALFMLSAPLETTLQPPRGLFCLLSRFANKDTATLKHWLLNHVNDECKCKLNFPGFYKTLCTIFLWVTF